MFTGKQPIVFIVQRNEGNKIYDMSSNLLVGSSGSPIVLKTVSAQIELKAEYYPYTFTVMVASYFAGKKGEGTYSLDVYCTDKSFKIKQM